MKKPLKTHNQIVEDLLEMFSMVYKIFYGVFVVLSGDVMNLIFCITLMIFVKGLQRYTGDGL